MLAGADGHLTPALVLELVQTGGLEYVDRNLVLEQNTEHLEHYYHDGEGLVQLDAVEHLRLAREDVVVEKYHAALVLVVLAGTVVHLKPAQGC